MLSNRVVTDRYVIPVPRSMPLRFGWVSRKVYAGPYYDKPANMIGVKLAPEVQAEAQYHLPIRDFSIPPVKLATDRLVFDVLTLLAVNMEPVYVGCMGGRGRTGMFLALLAKTMGVENPIPYVRTFYWQEAIETRIQEKYIDQYVTPLSRWQHWRLKGTAYWYGED